MSGSDSPVYEFESNDGSDRNSDYEDYEDRGAMSSGAEKGCLCSGFRCVLNTLLANDGSLQEVQPHS